MTITYAVVLAFFVGAAGTLLWLIVEAVNLPDEAMVVLDEDDARLPEGGSRAVSRDEHGGNRAAGREGESDG